MDWISGIVVTIIVVFFVAIMYKALKDPIDSVLELVKKGFSGIGNKISDTRAGTVEVIRYD